MTRTHSYVSLLLAFGVAVILSLAVVPYAHAQTQGSGNGAAQGSGNGAAQGSGNSATQGSGNAQSGTTGTLQNPLQFDTLPELLHAILAAVVELGTIVLGIMLVYVGFLFVSARGNPEEISKARSALIWTLIGGLILLGAEAISLVIQSTVASISS